VVYSRLDDLSYSSTFSIAPQPDDQEYQKSHKEALLALTHIEVEFARLRETYVLTFCHVVD